MPNDTNWIPQPHPVVDAEKKVTRPWLAFFQQITRNAAGYVFGPSSSTNHAIARWDGTTGTQLANSGITIADGATGTLSGTNTGDQDTFQTIAVSGQSDVVAGVPDDTLTLVAGTNIAITTNPATNEVTIAAVGAGGGTVTITGTPAAGNLTQFSGLTTITNGNLSGDVATSGTLVVTITNGAVTFAKLQDINTQRILGRDSGGLGPPEAITISQALDWLAAG